MVHTKHACRAAPLPAVREHSATCASNALVVWHPWTAHAGTTHTATCVSNGYVSMHAGCAHVPAHPRAWLRMRRNPAAFFDRAMISANGMSGGEDVVGRSLAGGDGDRIFYGFKMCG